MTLTQMRDELIEQGAQLLLRAEATGDEKIRAALVGKAEQTGKYVHALNNYVKEPQA